LYFGLCRLTSLIQAAEELQRPKHKDLRPKDLR
jgi:hypothetical protein